MRISIRRPKPASDQLPKPTSNARDVNNAARELLVHARNAAKRVDTGREVTVVIAKQHSNIDRPSLITHVKSLASNYGVQYVRDTEGTFTFTKL